MSSSNRRRARDIEDSARNAEATPALTRSRVDATTDDARAAHERALEKRVNHASDKDYQPSPTVAKGRDPDADVSALEEEPLLNGDGSVVPKAARVGYRTPVHPRASMAGAMHDALRDRAISDLSSDELSSIAASIGLDVDGTGANGAVLQSDLVRAMKALAYRYPKRKQFE